MSPHRPPREGQARKTSQPSAHPPTRREVRVQEEAVPFLEVVFRESESLVPLIASSQMAECDSKAGGWQEHWQEHGAPTAGRAAASPTCR